MLNRRLLRIKVLQALYSYQVDDSGDKRAKETYLLNSIKKVEDEYVFLLMLPVELRYYVENEQNPEEILYVPTKKDIDTGRTFIYNRLITQLDKDEDLKKKYKKTGLNWHNHKEVMKLVFNGFKTSKHFQIYLEEKEKNYTAQKALLLNFYKEFLPAHEEVNILMEELLIHWNDDAKAVFSVLVKTVEGMNEENTRVEQASMDASFDEDWEFTRTLFTKTIQHDEEYTAMISDKTKKWDAERIADVDLILMRMALCEMMEFPTIPVKVSINEYLDISKIYSTPKSSTFLNGILDKIMNELKESGKIKKSGRGLLE